MAKTAAAPADKRIQRIDRSPMNEQVWVIQLECGHDVYVTQKKRPSRDRTWTDKATGERLCASKRMACHKCAEKRK